MNEIETKTDNPTKSIKLYSSRAIGGATFLGGPLAAGYMIRENFKALGKPTEGRNSLIISIIATILLFTGVFMIPESMLDSIPTQIIPLTYTAIVFSIVEWKQGDILKLHKEYGNPFFSGWRAGLIGVVSLVIILIGVFGYVFFEINDEIYDQYDAELSVFSKNEEEGLVFYEHLDTESDPLLIKELKEVTIPKWNENIDIINRTNQLEDLPYELVQQNKLLLKYSELRLEAFELFKKALEEKKTDEYMMQLDSIHNEINEQLDNLEFNSY